MMMKTIALVAAIVFVASVSTLHVDATQEFMIPMRDGVRLHTLVDFPLFKDPKNLTAVLDRSPYGANGIELIALGFGLAEGFASVRQDQRGTGQSQGNFTMWHNSANDSYDTMLWISHQSWSNGMVVTTGASADGLASFPMAEDHPHWLKAQIIVFASSVGRDVIYPGGALRYALGTFWLESTVPNQAAHLLELIRAHEAPGPYWNGLDMTNKYGDVTFPSVMWAGWYDIFLNGNLAGFEGYLHDASPAYRNKTSLVIDPCGHCQDAAKTFYRNTLFGRALLPILQGYDLFKNVGKDGNEVEEYDPVSAILSEDVKALTFYVLGANDDLAPGNYWTTLDDFPKFTSTPYYIQADGTLSTTAPPKSQAASSFDFDPANPVPSVGGNNLKIKCGPLDQTSVEAPARKDVLTFTSAPLTDAVAVTGPLIGNVFVSSSAVDTDFTMKLTDYNPTTKESILIQDGIVRMRWRHLDQGQTTPELLTPGHIYNAQISLWNTSYVFAPGHSIRISVSSSNWPRFDVNPNNGKPLSQHGQGPNITATNMLYHDADHPSSILLPVVSLDQLPKTGVLEEMEARYHAAPANVRKALDSAMERFEAQIARVAGRSL